MKIVIPIAGKGTRLLPNTKFVPKPLIFLAGKSILDHIMDELIPLNPSEFVFITGYLKDDVEKYLTTRYPTISMRFLEQKDPQGLGHAIYQARDAFSKDEDMLVILGDQTFTIDWKKLLKNSCNRITVVPVSDPSSFGIVTLDKDGIVCDMVEKPENPQSNLAISGTYYFPSAQTVFSAIAHQISQDIRTKGEIQITDSMRIMMGLGEHFEVLEIQDWNDCGNHTDLLKANEMLLTTKGSQKGIYESDVTIIDPVWIHPTVKLSNVTIGPNVSLAENIEIKDSQLANTIVDRDTTIQDCKLKDSYIGRNLSLNNKEEIAYYIA